MTRCWHRWGATDERQRLGRRGERLAGRFLRRAGYRIIGTRVRVPMGEADLIALAPDGLTPVIVEVKTRRVGHGRTLAPEVALDARKRRVLARIARHLSRSNDWTDPAVRIDLIAVECPERGRATIRHHQAIIHP